MRTKKAQKLMSYIKKSVKALLMPCIYTCVLCSGCGQASSKEIDHKILSPQAMPTQVPEATPAPTSGASPTAIATQTAAPIPTLVPTPTPTPDIIPAWIFPFQNNMDDISTVFSAEEQDAIHNLTYAPHGHPELFARYHGHIDSFEYIIDVIKMDSEPRIMRDNLIRLQFYESPSSIWFEGSKMLQELNVYLDVYELMGMDNFIETFDLNRDGHTDFRLNLGIDVKNEHYLYFVYDEEINGYAYLGVFSYPTFFPDEQILYEISYFTNYTRATKYKIEGSKAFATESVSISYEGVNETYDLLYLYTYNQYVKENTVTTIETRSYDEFTKILDLSEWPGI